MALRTLIGLKLEKGALTGGIAGGIAGGIFGGSQHVLSTKKIDAGVSSISKAKARLDDAHKSLSNVKKQLNRRLVEQILLNL